MPYKDYYRTLGITQAPTTDVKYHPDKTCGDKAANEKFVEINEANQVISDPEKRKKYDQFGADRERYEQAGAQQGGFDWSKYASATGTQNQRMSPDEFESMFSGGGDIYLFELLFGQGGRRRQGRKSAAFKGDDAQK